MSDGTVIRFYINYIKMIDHGLTLTDLARESFGDDVVTNVSPDFMGMIDVEVPNEHLSQWLSRMGQQGVRDAQREVLRQAERRKSSTANPSAISEGGHEWHRRDGGVQDRQRSRETPSPPTTRPKWRPATASRRPPGSCGSSRGPPWFPIS